MDDERKEFARLRRYDALQQARQDTALATVARQFVTRVVYIRSGSYIFYTSDGSQVMTGDGMLYDALVMACRAAGMISESLGILETP